MNFEQAQKLKDKMATWHNRAGMALKQGNKELVRSALKHKRRYRKLLDELNGQSDNPPPFMSLVPRGLPPGAGAGELAIQLSQSESAE